MFHRLREGNRKTIAFSFDGRRIEGREGESVAAALLAADVEIFRTTVPSGEPRGPFCMMGVCFDCLVEIDGVANTQACMTPLRAGMNVAPQRRGRQLNP